jgi:hypothetical protein
MASNSRSDERSNVFLSASLDTGVQSIAVRVRNLSTGGAMLDGADLPPPGSRVRLKRGKLSAAGSISWAKNTRAGVKFDANFDVQPWVQRAEHPGQQQVDQTIAAVRAGADVSYVRAEVPNAPSLPLISEALDQICERLASKPGAAVEFGEELVKLDAIAQSLRQLAARRLVR